MVGINTRLFLQAGLCYCCVVLYLFIKVLTFAIGISELSETLLGNWAIGPNCPLFKFNNYGSAITFIPYGFDVARFNLNPWNLKQWAV